MDPITITATCVTLIATIAKVSFQIDVFIRQVQDSRSDLDVVSRELHSLRTTLEPMSDDVGDRQHNTLPMSLAAQIFGILNNCCVVLDQIRASLDKLTRGGLI